jgi:hypothetical protein
MLMQYYSEFKSISDQNTAYLNNAIMLIVTACIIFFIIILIAGILAMILKQS